MMRFGLFLNMRPKHETILCPRDVNNLFQESGSYVMKLEKSVFETSISRISSSFLLTWIFRFINQDKKIV